MIYKEFQPDTLLTDFVKNYWWFENSTTEQLDFTILPDGCFDLIISFNNYKQEEISLTGLWTKQVEVSIEPNRQLFGIRFKLLAVDYILQQNISAFCDSEQIKENDFWRLDKALFTDLEIETEKLDKIMLSILDIHKGIDSRKQNLFNLLYGTNGEKTIEQYSQQVFWTSRQINRYFKDRFGISLKSYCKILRCYASFKQIKKGQLYPEQNYFDQSHFIKDLKKYTGNNPSELFENKNDRFLQLATMKEN
ncbi:AraC family transcriptional regulator [Flavobacterium piscis]|uniref:AraC-like DNA-binding protein n=1 Tax=Flavobacterium piscis TaxID=1114874 RepID=A0ABU1Y7J6_9FLAO|nr:AraC family transcriptional regulator [Flavobacterium piscis]MDR7210203.1 AraC-like DNA-binding protein [Flavobacterium piscis]